MKFTGNAFRKTILKRQRDTAAVVKLLSAAVFSLSS